MSEPVSGRIPAPAPGVALVTGASRGLGRYIADALEGAGWRVEGGSTEVAPVTDRAAVTAWVDDVVARRGRIDLLVNGAGVIDAEVGILDSDPDDWWRTLEVNVLGVYLMTWLVGRHMREAGGGRIINLNSGAGTAPRPQSSAYSVSKTALARVTGSTQIDGARHGIHAFDLSPGVVRTDMTASMTIHRDRTEWTDPSEVTSLVLSIASGELDAWAGRMVRAGVDRASELVRVAASGLSDTARTLTLERYGAPDPI